MQVSFVNSICTLKGGTHVKLIIDQICKCASGLPAGPNVSLTHSRVHMCCA
jgi:DNA gyrase/topoisomerase IV subunit B